MATDTIIGLYDSAINVPGRLRLGDINADGFPEILLTLVHLKNDSGTYQTTQILMNEECTISTCSKGATDKLRRYFDQNAAEYNSLTQLTGTTSQVATFLDIDEDGRLDILVHRKASNGFTEMLCIYNNFVKDTFFIKALMINTPSKYGDAAVGSSYRLIVTDLNDNKFVVIGSQLAQQTYNSLQMPYCYIGVGRSNNYVESFTAATSISASRSIRVWTPIIPNSQLIIFSQAADANEWNLELFINPTSSLALIVVACLICLFIIGVVIIVLHIGEKKEDKTNRQNAFNYF